MATATARRLAQPTLTIERATLDNGLRVVMAPDKTAPAVAVCVLYDVGFRSEPEGRTGFAHLFEHLMFEGSYSLPKLRHAELVQGNGGVFNGQTRPDQTVYFEQLPAAALELGLFLEADRMRAVRLDEETLANQIAVVKEEIRVNVMNRPYGGFPWIQLPEVLFETYNNAHNGYGSFVDLESATVDDAADFFTRYYCPGNAILALVGDFDPGDALPLVERHFGVIAKRKVLRVPSFAEPVPKAERHKAHQDPLAPVPAVAVGYRTPDPLADLAPYLATVVAAEVLAEGDASRLHLRLVKKDRTASHVGGYVGTFGDPFDMRDPAMLQLLAYQSPGVTTERVLSSIDEEIDRAAADLPAAELARVVTSMQAELLRRLDDGVSLGLLLACEEQLRGDPEVAVRLPAMLGEVTPEAVQQALETWLRPNQRAVLEIVPGGAPAPPPAEASVPAAVVPPAARKARAKTTRPAKKAAAKRAPAGGARPTKAPAAAATKTPASAKTSSPRATKKTAASPAPAKSAARKAPAAKAPAAKATPAKAPASKATPAKAPAAKAPAAKAPAAKATPAKAPAAKAPAAKAPAAKATPAKATPTKAPAKRTAPTAAGKAPPKAAATGKKSATKATPARKASKKAGGEG